MSERETSVQEDFAKLGIVTIANPILENEGEVDNAELENNISTLTEYCGHVDIIIRGRIGDLGAAAGFIGEDVFAIQIDDGKQVVLIYSKSGNNISISTGDRARSYYSKSHIGRLYKKDARLFKDAVEVLCKEIEPN